MGRDEMGWDMVVVCGVISYSMGGLTLVLSH